MFTTKSSRRLRPEVNAGSMADIAFLLLIFFLVTTTILSDSGILVRLPVWNDEPITEKVSDKNTFTIKINKKDQLLIEGERANLSILKTRLKEFILNPSNDPNMPDKPTKAVISLQNDRGTTYDMYLQVYNEIKAANRELWDAQARKNYGFAYKDLSIAQQKNIRNEIPFIISEAEPTDYERD